MYIVISLNYYIVLSQKNEYEINTMYMSIVTNSSPAAAFPRHGSRNNGGFFWPGIKVWYVRIRKDWIGHVTLMVQTHWFMAERYNVSCLRSCQNPNQSFYRYSYSIFINPLTIATSRLSIKYGRILNFISNLTFSRKNFITGVTIKIMLSPNKICKIQLLLQQYGTLWQCLEYSGHIS